MKRITTRILFLQKSSSDISECIQHYDLVVDDDTSEELVSEKISEMHRRLTEEDEGQEYKKYGLQPVHLLEKVCKENGWECDEIDYGIRLAFDVSDPAKYVVASEEEE